MKYYEIWEWNAENQHLNAQGSRLILVALQVGAVMKALKKNERQGETQFTTKTKVLPTLEC
jgi:streptomycin 6-kinase